MAGKNDNSAEKPAKKRHVLRNISVTILIIILIGVGAFYYLYLQGGIIGLAVSAASNPSNLTSILTQRIAQSNEIAVSYNGTIHGNVTLPTGDPLYTSSFNVSVKKYYNNTRVTFSLQNGSILPNGNSGSFSAVGISLENGTDHVCYSVDHGAYVCGTVMGGSLINTMKGLTSLFNITIESASIGTVTPSFYGSMPCWRVNGHAVVMSPGIDQLIGSSSADIYFDACISPKDNMPLYADAAITTPGNANTILIIELNHFSETQATTETEVTNLP